MRSIFLLIIFLPTLPFAASAVTVELVGTVPGCGDGVIVSGEQCDTSDFGGTSCSSLGFSGGALSCTSSCTINTSACAGSIFTGGGGGGDVPIIPSTNVVFVGRAYPRSVVTLLKDAQVVATTTAGTYANFQISISGVSGGNYVFSVYSDDNKGVRGASLTFPIRVASGATTKVSGIFIAPTITADKTEVKRGDHIAIFGQSVPGSEITVSANGIDSDKEYFVNKTTDVNGAYVLDLDTSLFARGAYRVKAKSSLGVESSPFGRMADFLVSTKSVPAQISKKSKLKGDFNNDGRVNLTDFSIILYWYNRPSPPLLVDMDSNGKVNLTDFSIFVFYWTG